MGTFFNIAQRAPSDKPSPPSFPKQASLGELVRKIVGKTLCMIGLLASVTAFLSGYLAPLYIPFDLFNHLSVHLSIAILSFGLSLFLHRFSLTVSLALIVLGFFAIGAYGRWGPWPATRAGDSSVAPQTLPLKVMSFNVLYQNEEWHEIVTAIQQQDPDIVTLVEFAEHHHAVLEALQERWPYQKVCLDHPSCNFAVLSKIAIKDIDIPKMPSEHGRASPYFKVSFAPPYTEFVVVGVHTSRAPWFRLQYMQLKNLKNYLLEIPQEKIVMGDFNSTPFSWVNKEFAKNAHLNRVTFLPSWPAHFGLPQIAIDHLFISQGISVLSPPTLGRSAGSDHYPVIATFGVPKP